MHRYDCKVRLAGQLHNEVRKREVSAAEIIILRTIHGDDAVTEIQKRRNDRGVSYDQERLYLENEYEKGLREVRTTMTALFGPRHQQLPEKLPNYVYEDETDAEPEPPKNKSGRPRKSDAPAVVSHEELVE